MIFGGLWAGQIYDKISNHMHSIVAPVNSSSRSAQWVQESFHMRWKDCASWNRRLSCFFCQSWFYHLWGNWNWQAETWVTWTGGRSCNIEREKWCEDGESECKVWESNFEDWESERKEGWVTTKLELKLTDWSARLGRGVILGCLALTRRFEVETKWLVLGRYSVEEVIKAGVFGKASLQRRTATPPGSRN